MKTLFCILLLIICSSVLTANARELFSPDKMLYGQVIDETPYVTLRVHDIGKIGLTVTNYGVIGRGSDEPVADPVTGDPIPSLSYPRGYGLNYLYDGGIWVGAVLGRDTLVSTGTGPFYSIHEFWPDTFPMGDIIHRSTLDPDAPEYQGAISQQDYIAVYYDTLTNPLYTNYDYYSGRFHRPLNIKVTQRSYSWGYDYADDFVIFDYEVANIGFFDLKDVYVGIYMDNDCGRDYRYVGYDDICGFKKVLPSRYIAGLQDTVNLAWAADNDGDPDPISGQFAGPWSPTSAVATRILRTPGDSMRLSYNWWIADYNVHDDWGPRKAGTDADPFRSFDGYLGTPVGDKNKYYMMSHPEFDYDQSQTYIDHTSQGWLPPPEDAARLSYGADIRYLLSFGPFDLGPGDAVPFTFAVVAGQNFYRRNPDAYRDFADLGLNALWAGWVFDNPGVDTDGDGNKGKYHSYCLDSELVRVDTIYHPSDTVYDTVYGCLWGDTIYYQGDGIPDFKGAAPPPAPKVRLAPRINNMNQGEIKISWNGRLSETSADQFSQQIDFEGYRVYTSLTGRVYDYTLVTSFDLENYDRWEYDPYLKIWQVLNPPYTMRLLRQMYGDNIEPTRFYDADHLFVFYNARKRKYESYYFSRHDWNQSDFRDTTRIHKLYPDQPYPSTLNLDSAVMFYPNELTDKGELKYFEYEFTLKNLLPSQQYYVTVTAFDQGIPGKNLRAQETDPTLNAQREFAQNSTELVKQKGLNVIAYPNPYKIDAGYRERFEGWERPDLPAERTRAIHFTNLPNKCTIRIFTLDGDLVREIKHDFPEGSAGSMHDSWDLISRNTMAVTSGIYYFQVDSELGNQIGKLVIIK